LPKLVYSSEEAGAPAHVDSVDDAPPQDASVIDWKPALRASVLMAVPAGLLSSELSPVSGLGLLWMATAAIWAVILYMRSKRSPWITTGAGARIGLVTGILAGWLAFTVSGAALFTQRFLLHQAVQLDAQYEQTFVQSFQQRIQQSLAGMGQPDAAQAQIIFSAMLNWLKSPDGHAGMWAGSLAFSSVFLLFFAVCGGAMSARMMAHRRRPQL
jgi:hypothetical protein